MTGLLRRALDAFERYEEEEAVRRLLEAWREVRSERIAVLTERLTKLAHRTTVRTGLLGLPGLLDALVENAAQYTPKGVGQELGRHQLWTADPRFTPALLTLAAQPKAYEGEFFRPLCELLILVKDPRALAPLRALHGSLPGYTLYAQRLALVLSLIAEVGTPSLEAEASALCDALEEAVTRREEDAVRGTPLREELLVRIGANPEDNEARLVLADLLLQAGDPLGEFIMLQCQPQPDEARINPLLALHGAKWDALLGPYVEPGWTRFERGLPVAVRLKVPLRADLPPPSPFWCTVRELDLDYAHGHAVVEWLTHPHLRNVTELRRVATHIARRLGQHPLPLRRLEMQGRITDEGPNFFNLLDPLPNLNHLEMRGAGPTEVIRCAGSTLRPRLVHFEASARDAWSLVASFEQEVPIEVTLLNDMYRVTLAEIIRAAKRFTLQGLRIRSRLPLSPDTRRVLEAAASGYLRVEWDLPPGSG